MTAQVEDEAEVHGGRFAQLRGSRVARVLTSRVTILIVLTLVVAYYFNVQSDGIFLTTSNGSLLLRQTAVTAVLAAGVALLIIMGEIDLSIGSAVLLSGLVAAKCDAAGWPVSASVLAAIATGVVVGVVQGTIVARLGVPSFIVTLGGMLGLQGLALLITNAASVGPLSLEFSDITEKKMSFPVALILALLLVGFAIMRGRTTNKFARDSSGENASMGALARVVIVPIVLAALVIWGSTSKQGLPNALLWLVVVAALLSTLLYRAKFGRRAFLVGSNREAARYAGIGVPAIVTTGFLIMGVLYGLGGVMSVARLGSWNPTTGTGLELVAIAAAVIGGNSLRGGIGSIIGAITGAFFLSAIDNGMALMGVSNFAANIVKATLLVVAVALDGYFVNKRASG
jgi:D-xylose transport system permease protein